MNLLEFVAAVAIALYAMTGGAFINAAITAPENLRKLLIAGRQSVFEFMVYGMAFLVVGMGATVFLGDAGSLIGNPFLWMAAAHLALYGVFRGCRMIVEILLTDADNAHEDDKHTVGPDKR